MTPIQLPNESQRAYDAFKSYCEDPKRSIRRCARKLRKSPTIIARWSKRHHWQQRIRELMIADAERSARAADAAALLLAEEKERLRLRHKEQKLRAAEKLFARAHEVLRQSTKNSRPSDSARMFIVAALLGDQVLGLGAGTGGKLNPTVAPIFRVVLRRDAQSSIAKQKEDEFFARHSELRRPKNGFELEDADGSGLAAG